MEQTMQRLGIIDLGSNSARMQVMAFEPHAHFKLVDEIKETVRLVEGAAATNVLQPEPIRRAIKAVRMFAALGRATDVPRIIGIATSAVRDAQNRDDVLRQLEHETGIAFRVVSGDEEARYGYLGVINSMPLRDGFTVDIGGGSAQVSLVRNRGFVQAVSLPLGAVRMTEQFIHTDPPQKGEWKAIEACVEAGLSEHAWFKLEPGMQFVGLGGTIRNLANIDQHVQGYSVARLHAYQLRLDRVDALCRLLRKLPRKERELVPGINDERADVLVAGALVLRQLMRISNTPAVEVSGEGLREGVFYEQFLPGQTEPIIANVRTFGVRNLAAHYTVQQKHVDRVCDLVLAMFDQLQSLHGYGQWERELLWAAAILHDVGVDINYYDHHRHSAYIVMHGALPGYTHREIALIALLTQYHRKGTITTGALQAVLEPGDDERVARLSALLRIAEYLERSKSQVVTGLTCSVGKTVEINTETIGDASVEIWDANRRAGLFRKAFGLDIIIK
ncbi:MAG: Ppx/GppA phosphatase family protein [Herpetosiphon sp.]